MGNLIERLHDVAAASRNHDGETDALIDAANTIERLTAQIKALESDDHEWYLQARHIEKLESASRSQLLCIADQDKTILKLSTALADTEQT